jgi:hypothetical protein
MIVVYKNSIHLDQFLYNLTFPIRYLTPINALWQAIIINQKVLIVNPFLNIALPPLQLLLAHLDCL